MRVFFNIAVSNELRKVIFAILSLLLGRFFQLLNGVSLLLLEHPEFENLLSGVPSAYA